MPSWAELVQQFSAEPEPNRGAWASAKLTEHLQDVSALRGGRNVIFYGSAFLQKGATIPGAYLAVSGEDINGLMSAVHGMHCDRGLTLMLHTPGGDVGAAQTLGDYLHSKFENIECVVPTFAMSAGTMLALGCDEIIMGRQSQLGPIDAQLNINGRQFSAGGVKAQFERAASEILADPRMAHVWAPILQQMGPSVLQDAEYALRFGSSLVERWLAGRMFRGAHDPAASAKKVADYFNATDAHLYHGRRIDRAEARAQGVNVTDLEPTPDLQNAVLSAYHLATILFETSPTAKLIWNNAGKAWVKNFVT